MPPVRPFCLVAALLLTAAACTPPPSPPASEPSVTVEAPHTDASARRIQADVAFLADDLLEGREAGTRGHELAALYVARRMQAIGLQPAGDDGGYMQQVPLLQATRVEEGSSLELIRDGRTTALAFGEEFLPALNFDAADARVEAPAVFVGQGVHAPELQHDDFAGVDVRGKIAVLFAGSPARFDNDRRAFHASSRQKLAALVERGAVGAVFIGTRDSESRSPWSRSQENWQRPGMRLRDADGRGIDTFPELRVVASTSAAAASALFAGSGRAPAALFALAEDGTPGSFELPGTIRLRASTRLESAESRNVVGRLPGRDPVLDAEHVVFTAHLDHIGIGAPVGGDSIYNGALDNALGVAVMLEAARDLAWSDQSPKRSMLFVAVTAEEKGLLGAEWFVRSPTVARESLVANVNVDMPVLLTPTRDVVPIGLEHSTLQPQVEAAARAQGVALSPDPFPEQNVFVRSDQYAFIRAGIPAVYLKGGVQASADDDDAREVLAGFMRDRYHQPSDDLSQSIQYADAARLAQLNARIGRAVGDGLQRPAWNAGDFFGDRFGAQAASPAPEAQPAAQ
ncbi:MAG: M28 family metallopeptidase [Pseudomonadota bacterium]|nr:M28 family metallopeptidase [Pseudomonadota bacterium]